MSTPIQNLPQRQVMLSFAYLAYCGEFITTPNPGPTILGYINSAMPQIPPLLGSNGDPAWTIAWLGNAYTQPGALYQDNFMYVAQNIADPTQYAIAIRGTNFKSGLNWLMEDFDILQMMSWPLDGTSTPGGAMVSESVSIGMNILLAMEGTGPGGNSSTLMAFLQTATQNDSNPTPISVCATGHSLGGMLASTLALYLSDNRSTWDATGNSFISCITFAAPTAGNPAFATYSDKTFAAMKAPANWDATLGTNCDAVRCNLDVAPQLYIAANLSNASSGSPTSPFFATYGDNLNFKNLHHENGIAWGAINDHVLPMIAKLLSGNGFTQVVANAVQLQGNFRPLKDLGLPFTITPLSGNTVQNYLEAFAAEGGWQHSNSYPIALGVPAVQNPAIIVRT